MRARPPIVPDVLVPGLRLVFCGTAPSKASAAARAYYAKPVNRFWPALHEAGFTPRRFHPSEYVALAGLGIGLTDLCKGHSGNDDELPEGALDREALRARILRFRPAVVAFTSKNAGRAFLFPVKVIEDLKGIEEVRAKDSGPDCRVQQVKLTGEFSRIIFSGFKNPVGNPYEIVVRDCVFLSHTVIPGVSGHKG